MPFHIPALHFVCFNFRAISAIKIKKARHYNRWSCSCRGHFTPLHFLSWFIDALTIPFYPPRLIRLLIWLPLRGVQNHVRGIFREYSLNQKSSKREALALFQRFTYVRNLACRRGLVSGCRRADCWWFVQRRGVHSHCSWTKAKYN